MSPRAPRDHRLPATVIRRHLLAPGPAVSDAYDGAERRASNGERLDRIADDLAGLRAEFASFRQAQGAINAEMREHVVRASSLGDVHESTYQSVRMEQDSHARRIHELEDWRVELTAYGRLLRLTFGASVIGAILALLSLLDMLRRGMP